MRNIPGFTEQMPHRRPRAGDRRGLQEPGPRRHAASRSPNGGRDAFYKGEIAHTIVASSKANGGFLAYEGLRRRTTATGSSRSTTTYRGYDVWELPPPGQGIAALQMLNLLEGYDLKKMGPAVADHLHLFVEAKKLAYADRAKFYADPDFAKVPVAELISKAYARERAQADRPATTRSTARRRRPEARARRHDLPARRGQGPQLRLADPEQLPRLRLRPDAARDSASRSRTAARCSRSTEATPTRSSRTSGRSTRSSRRS